MSHGVQPVVTDGKSAQLNGDLQLNMQVDMVVARVPRTILKAQCVALHGGPSA